MSADNLEKMNIEKRKMIEELYAQLEWYTKEASEEEFDSKAVESILYLLDVYEPMEETYTNVDEAWERFEKRVTEGNISRELLERSALPECEFAEKSGAFGISESKIYQGTKKIIDFMWRKKMLVATVLVIWVLACVGTTQAEAIRESGFFFWLRQDEGGRQMITMPESLDSTLDKENNKIYYDRDEVPEWCEELLKEENELDVGEVFEWKYVKVVHMDNLKVVKSQYSNGLTSDEVTVGVISYAERITINMELFEAYSYVGSYGEEEDPIYIYNRVEESGAISYQLCRIEENRIYFVEGTELELLKELAKKYLEN